MAVDMQSQTMEVRINGKIERRPIDHYSRVDHHYYPTVGDEEDLLWFLGDPIPTVVRRKR